MILQALARFHERMVEESVAAVALEGFEWKRIPFVIVLDPEGTVVAVQDTRIGDPGERHGSLFLVPKGAKKTSGVSANLFWDNPSYVLAHPKEGLPKHARKLAEQAKERQQCFIDLIKQRFPDPVRDPGVRAVLLFLERGDYRQITACDDWAEIKGKRYNLTFRLKGDDCLVCQRPSVRRSLAAGSEELPGAGQTCLVTGARVTPIRLHTAVQGVWGVLPSGAPLVSFAQHAFCSYGKTQGHNAPIGKQAEFAYTTALNMLLASPKHRLQIGDATAVFWSEGNSVLEEHFAELFKAPSKENLDRMRAVLESPSRNTKSGSPAQDSEVKRFFLLALAPNVARLAVRMWYSGTVAETVQHVVQHFEDCRIVHHGRQSQYPSLFQLITSTAYLGKSEHIESSLACDLMRSILDGSNYPHALLISVLRRCCAERDVTHPRAALIKAILVRQARGCETERTIGAGLDQGNREPGYLLGRLLALIERTQQTAIPGIQRTIRDSYYGTASRTPELVFPRLVKLRGHYSEKIGKTVEAVLLEEQAGEICHALDGYPSSLPPQGQALFALGYYHQRQDTYQTYCPDKESGT